MKHICGVCGWEYDEELGCPEEGIAPGTKWEDLPEDFHCPLCCVGKEEFSAEYSEMTKPRRFGGALSFFETQVVIKNLKWKIENCGVPSGLFQSLPKAIL